MGVVTAVSPLEITHCTETDNINGIAYDRNIDGWTHFGWLDGVSFEPEEEETTMAQKATVYAQNGEPVKLRPSPSTKKPYTMKVPVGTVVTVNGGNDEWMQVSVNGKTGYMMTEFLQMENAAENTEAPQQEAHAPDFEEKVMAMLEAILDNLNTMGGVG